MDSLRSITSSLVPRSATVNESNGRLHAFDIHSIKVNLEASHTNDLDLPTVYVLPVPGSPSIR